MAGTMAKPGHQSLLTKLASSRGAVALAAFTVLGLLWLYLSPGKTGGNDPQLMRIIYTKPAEAEGAKPNPQEELHIVTLMCDDDDAVQARGLFKSLVMQAQHAATYSYTFDVFLNKKHSQHMESIVQIDKDSQACPGKVRVQAHFFEDFRAPRLFSSECEHEHLSVAYYMGQFSWRRMLFVDVTSRILRPLPDIFAAMSTFKDEEVFGLVPKLNDAGEQDGFYPDLVLLDLVKFHERQVYTKLTDRVKLDRKKFQKEVDIFVDEASASPSMVHSLPCHLFISTEGHQPLPKHCDTYLPWVVNADSNKSPLVRWFFAPLDDARVEGSTGGTVALGPTMVPIPFLGCDAPSDR